MVFTLAHALRAFAVVMSFSLACALLAFAIVLIVFLVVYRMRGQRSAFVAGGLTFVTMFTLFVAMVMLITSRM